MTDQEYTVTVKAQTPKAVKVVGDGLPGGIWLPRSQVNIPETANRNDVLTLHIPAWLIKQQFSWVGDPDC